MLKTGLFLLSLFGVGVLSAKTIEVCSDCEFKSIKEAVKASVAHDKIVVKKGNYLEDHILIEHPLGLIAEPGTTIDGQGKGEIIIVQSDDVKISGFNIIKSGRSHVNDVAAVRVESSKNCIIENNTFKETFFAIFLGKTENCKVLSNKIFGPFWAENLSGDGIHIWYGEGSIVQDNEIYGHRDGIYLEFAKNGTIQNNKSYKNHRYGLHFMFSGGNAFTNNLFSQNGAGVAVMYSQNIVMRKNIFSKNWGAAAYGILLKDISRSLIEDNLFTENTVAIYMEGGNESQFIKNNFIANGWAIRVFSSCEKNRFEDNNFINNTFDVTTNSFNSYNDFQRNYWSHAAALDINKTGFGSLPYRPVKLSAVLMEQYSLSSVLIKSAFFHILDIVESIFPIVTPVNLIDSEPRTEMVK